MVGQLAAAVVFAGVPIALFGIARFAVRNLAAPDYVQIPLLAKLTISAGLVLGVAQLYVLARPEFYTMEQVFNVEGPWNLTLAEFLATRVNPLDVNLGDLSRSLTFEEWGSFPSILLGGAVALALMAVVACFCYWRPHQALMSVAVSLFTILVAAYVVFYLACGTLWVANTFNFWMFLIILALYQWHRRAL